MDIDESGAGAGERRVTSPWLAGEGLERAGNLARDLQGLAGESRRWWRSGGSAMKWLKMAAVLAMVAVPRWAGADEIAPGHEETISVTASIPMYVEVDATDSQIHFGAPYRFGGIHGHPDALVPTATGVKQSAYNLQWVPYPYKQLNDGIATVVFRSNCYYRLDLSCPAGPLTHENGVSTMPTEFGFARRGIFARRQTGWDYLWWAQAGVSGPTHFGTSEINAASGSVTTDWVAPGETEYYIRVHMTRNGLNDLAGTYTSSMMFTLHSTSITEQK